MRQGSEKNNAIQRELERLHAILDSIDAIIYVADPDTYEILYINKFFRDMLGKDPTGKLCYEEFQGKTAPCEFCTNPIIRANKNEPYRWDYHNPVVDRDYHLVDRIITWPDGRDVRLEVAVDITDRKKVMDEVQEREELYQALFEQLSDALFLEDLDGHIIEANESACRLLGYSREEIVRLSVADLIPDGAKRFNPEVIDQKTRTGKSVETVNRRKDGTVIPIELRGRIIDLQGSPHMIISARDISDRMRARTVEQVLQRITAAANAASGLESLFPTIKDILSAVMDTTNFSVALYDRETDTITVPYMTDERDTFRSFAAANTPTAYVIRNNRPLLLTAENRPTLTAELGIESVGAISKAWLGVPLRLEDQVIGAVIVQSYTDPNSYGEEDIVLLEAASGQISMAIVREQAKAELEESESRYRSIFSSTIDAILLFDATGTIVDANPAAYQMYGYASGELVGLSAERIVHPDYYHGFTNFKRKIKEGGAFAADSLNLRKDGTVFPVEVRGTGLLYQGELHYLSITRDISDRVAAEQELARAREKIERLHEIAHQLESCDQEEDVYRITVESAEKILDFSLCTLDIVEGDQLVAKATSSGLPPEASRSASLSEESLATKTFHTGKTYVIGSPADDPATRPTRTEFRSGISAPIGKFGVFQVASTVKNAFAPEDVRLLELLLGHTAQAIARIRLQRQLRDQAIHDPLTGVYNRRYFTEVVEQEIARSKRYVHPLGFLMIDIDHFKMINDRFGHQMGDRVLQAVAELLQSQVRDTDLVVRYGGDEFLVMLIETNGETDTVKQRIHNAVAKRNETNELIPFSVTLSIGSAHWDPTSKKPIELILAEADRRMYAEKTG